MIATDDLDNRVCRGLRAGGRLVLFSTPTHRFRNLGKTLGTWEGSID